MSYMWLEMEYITRFNKKRKHTASVQKKSEIRGILERYDSSPEHVTQLSLNGKQYDPKELLGGD